MCARAEHQLRPRLGLVVSTCIACESSGVQTRHGTSERAQPDPVYRRPLVHWVGMHLFAPLTAAQRLTVGLQKPWRGGWRDRGWWRRWCVWSCCHLQAIYA